jgi:hypothetical protein
MTNGRHIESGWSVTNVIRADSHNFTSMYESIEKDTIVYESETWLRTHDALVFEIRVYRYWTYRWRSQSSNKVDCDILTQDLIGLIKCSCH